MHGRWWRWLGTVLAIVCGLVFGWVAGTGLVHAASIGVTDAAYCMPAQRPGTEDQPSAAAKCSSVRFQPSSASSLR